MDTKRKPVQMAVIGAPHGIRGELRVRSFTADPLALADYGPLHAEDGRRFEILDIRLQKDMVVVRFNGVADRTAAEALTGTALFVDREALPDDLEEEEFYHADLIGLAVFGPDGAPIGKVVAIQDFGGGEILEIARGGRATAMVPFTRAAVPEIDIAAGRLTVDPIAAGLAEEGDNDATDGDE